MRGLLYFQREAPRWKQSSPCLCCLQEKAKREETRCIRLPGLPSEYTKCSKQGCCRQIYLQRRRLYHELRLFPKAQVWGNNQRLNQQRRVYQRNTGKLSTGFGPLPGTIEYVRRLEMADYLRRVRTYLEGVQDTWAYARLARE